MARISHGPLPELRTKYGWNGKLFYRVEILLKRNTKKPQLAGVNGCTFSTSFIFVQQLYLIKKPKLTGTHRGPAHHIRSRSAL